jgi:hypothetical protein
VRKDSKNYDTKQIIFNKFGFSQIMSSQRGQARCVRNFWQMADDN